MFSPNTCASAVKETSFTLNGDTTSFDLNRPGISLWLEEIKKSLKQEGQCDKPLESVIDLLIKITLSRPGEEEARNQIAEELLAHSEELMVFTTARALMVKGALPDELFDSNDYGRINSATAMASILQSAGYGVGFEPRDIVGNVRHRVSKWDNELDTVNELLNSPIADHA